MRVNSSLIIFLYIICEVIYFFIAMYCSLNISKCNLLSYNITLIEIFELYFVKNPVTFKYSTHFFYIFLVIFLVRNLIYYQYESVINQ